MNEKYGYTPNEVENICIKASNVSHEICSMMVNHLENDFVKPISTIWYAEEAVKYFTKLKNDMVTYQTSIENIFNSFISTIKKAATIWSQKTYGENINGELVSNLNIKIDISMIKSKKDDGEIFLDISNMTDIINKIEIIKDTIKNNVNDLKKNFISDLSFMGSNQIEYAENCFSSVLESLNLNFEEIDEKLKKELLEFVNKYQITASNTFLKLIS